VGHHLNRHVVAASAKLDHPHLTGIEALGPSIDGFVRLLAYDSVTGSVIIPVVVAITVVITIPVIVTVTIVIIVIIPIPVAIAVPVSVVVTISVIVIVAIIVAVPVVVPVPIQPIARRPMKLGISIRRGCLRRRRSHARQQRSRRQHRKRDDDERRPEHLHEPSEHPFLWRVARTSIAQSDAGAVHVRITPEPGHDRHSAAGRRPGAGRRGEPYSTWRIPTVPA
jgi:hypothetical protein